MPENTFHIEQDMLRRIAEGDERAFTEFYNRHWRQVYTFLTRMTKSHEIAEELMCDIFTKLWTGRELIAEIRNMDAFLARVSYNKAISFFRMAASQRKLQVIIARQMQELQSADAADKLLESETREILHEAIQQLSPQRKLIFTLSREQGLTHEEIARQLNLSTSTVKKTISNALSFIRVFLSSRGVHGMALLYFYMDAHGK